LEFKKRRDLLDWGRATEHFSELRGGQEDLRRDLLDWGRGAEHFSERRGGKEDLRRDLLDWGRGTEHFSERRGGQEDLRRFLLDWGRGTEHFSERRGGQEDPDKILQQAGQLVHLQVYPSYAHKRRFFKTFTLRFGSGSALIVVGWIRNQEGKMNRKNRKSKDISSAGY
jgi:hypothetical protein